MRDLAQLRPKLLVPRVGHRIISKIVCILNLARTEVLVRLWAPRPLVSLATAGRMESVRLRVLVLMLLHATITKAIRVLSRVLATKHSTTEDTCKELTTSEGNILPMVVGHHI
jgi:hypothetical protein